MTRSVSLALSVFLLSCAAQPHTVQPCAPDHPYYAGPPTTPRLSPSLWTAEIRVYRLSRVRDLSSTPSLPTFEGHPILCSAVLSSDQRNTLFSFLASATERRRRDEAEAALACEGALGGIMGSVCRSFAISFRTSTRTIDAWACCHCNRVESLSRETSGDPTLQILLTSDEEAWLSRFLSALLPCQPPA